jgi:uncharacterized phage-associated protein
MSADLNKLQQLILRIGNNPHVQNLGETKLWKLIYFADVAALREHGRTITGSEFIRYDHGPVPSRGEKCLKVLTRAGALTITQEDHGTHRLNRVVPACEADEHAFSAEERHLIDQVCRQLGGKTAAALSELSHQEPAWRYAGRLAKLEPELMLYGSSEDPEGL